MKSDLRVTPAERLRSAFALPHAGSRYAALEGYRAIAALMVVTYHVSGRQGLTYPNNLSGRLLSGLGNFGVCVFLLLSGFLLFQPFVRAHFRDTPNRDLKLYLRHRFLRILPAYWLALTVSLLVIPSTLKNGPTPAFDVAVYAKLYFLLGNFFASLQFSGLAVAWTLHLEVIFYVTLPLLAWLARRVFGRHALTLPRKVQANLALLALMLVICLVFRMVSVYQADAYAMEGHWFPNFLEWFALGMLLAVIACWQDRGGTLPKWLRSAASSVGFCWLAGAVVYLIYVLTAQHNGTGPESLLQQIAHYEIAALAAVIILIPATLGTNRNDPGRRLLQSRPFAFLGMISYGIYLWHAPIINWTINTKWWTQLKAGGGGAFWFQFTVILGAAIVFATASYVLLEKPMMRLKNPRKPARAHVVLSSGSPSIDGQRALTDDHPDETLRELADDDQIFVPAGRA